MWLLNQAWFVPFALWFIKWLIFDNLDTIYLRFFPLWSCLHFPGESSQYFSWFEVCFLAIWFHLSSFPLIRTLINFCKSHWLTIVITQLEDIVTLKLTALSKLMKHFHLLSLDCSDFQLFVNFHHSLVDALNALHMKDSLFTWIKAFDWLFEDLHLSLYSYH